jgi:glycosyltransferase involved in cell wall biosynthesis
MSAKLTPSRRIVFDVSWMLRWAGPTVGIVRVQRQLANWIHQHIANVEFVFFDPDQQRYRRLNPKFLEALLAGRACVDLLGSTNPVRPGRRRYDRIPRVLKTPALWLMRFPHMLLRSLERIRSTTHNPIVLTVAENLQKPLMSSRQRSTLVDEDGRRRASLPLDLACGDALGLQTNDTLVCTGSGWLDTNICAIASAKERTGFRFVLLCHDIIPLQFPNFYKTHDVAAFRDYYDLALPLADLVVFTSHAVERDVKSYCANHALKLGRTAMTPLGADPVAGCSDQAVDLPSGLVRDKFILFVSTIEPRKGHEFLLAVWLRLLQEGLPQRTGFKLVFVGRAGWMMQNFLQTMTMDSRIKETVRLLSTVDDKTLACLYRNAAFCAYPSTYEGYGLPVVESFYYGKAVLSSNGGALQEIVGDFSPTLEVGDADLWYRTLKLWVEDPSQRIAYEDAIRSGFRHPTWAQAAKQFCAVLEG